MIRALVLLSGLIAATPALSQEAISGTGAMLRVLDKTTGATTDIELGIDQTIRSGRLEIYLGDCRYPAGNAAGDAYALLAILPEGQSELAFRGWMIGSSPALNAMEHPRYDVWVLRCITS